MLYLCISIGFSVEHCKTVSENARLYMYSYLSFQHRLFMYPTNQWIIRLNVIGELT